MVIDGGKGDGPHLAINSRAPERCEGQAALWPSVKWAMVQTLCLESIARLTERSSGATSPTNEAS